MPRTTLDQSYQEEITQAFHIFDTRRTGEITPNALKLLLRALGFRVTKHEVWKEIIEGNVRLGRSTTSEILRNIDNEQGNDSSDIDLELVMDVIQERYHENIDPHTAMKINFRLFDVDNKGYIQLSDLKKVINEVNREFKEMGMDGEHLPTLRDDQIKAMIEEFDGDQDDVINFAEFKHIMKFA
jgi:Ca2+-binding EF-hand superfamily protein